MPRGIPHSAFLAWSPDDQDKALAYVAEESAHCGRCRTRADEWDPKQGGHRHAYVVEPQRCLGCEALAQAQRELEREEQADMLGVHLALVPNPDREEELA